MTRPLIAAVALVLLAAAGWAAPAASDGTAALSEWLQRFRRNGPLTDLESVQALEGLVAELAAPHTSAPSEAARLALLDLAGVRTQAEERALLRDREAAEQISRQTDRIRERGLDALAELLQRDAAGGTARWLATEVLVRTEQPTARRLAGIRLLAGRYLPGTELALFHCALEEGGEESAELRAAAMRALAGWPDSGVHRFMLKQRAELMERSERGEREAWVPRSSLRQHFEQVRLDPASSEGRELMAQATRAALGADWREAFRAIVLMRCLPNDPTVPALIAALGTWIDRRTQATSGDKEAGAHSRRMEYELLRELERRSGRHLGPRPERWRTWWKAVGNHPDAIGDSEESAASLTRAAFFGLRPATDRVVFVIDRSGSMKADFGDGERSRYGEVIEQMLSFLRTLGPDARFSVVLFSSDIEPWKDKLQRATPGNLTAVERWLRYRSPAGGTYLQPAVEHAMHLDARGQVELDRLEADSIIVLCDGATAEGPRWIEPLLERVNDDACLAFHGVQVGTRGDGALERLAELSGGSFVVVQ